VNSNSVLYFAEPIGEGWVYPCKVDDLREAIERLPSDDISGLAAVGLAASTRKDCGANARYIVEPKPRILVYSYPTDLTTRLDRKTNMAGARRFYYAELDAGMELLEVDGRVTCRWTPENLRRFICGHVLLHEVGHHVYRHRLRVEFTGKQRDRHESEKFAEHYALRMQRQSG
jgi:hypothetical protein